jgi:hypothetical protein
MLAVLIAGLADVNGLPTVAVTVTDPLPPAATVPIFQVIVLLLLEQLPVQLLYVKPLGNGSEMTTLLAEMLP